MKCIIYKKSNEGVAIGIICDGSGKVIVGEDNLEAHAQGIVDSNPQFEAFRITDSKNLPGGSADGSYDSHFRNAFTDSNTGETVGINLESARVIQDGKIRAARDSKWEDFDKRYLAASRDGADMAGLDAERKMLKDIPGKAKAKIAAAKNTDALKVVFPEELK